MSVLRLLTVAAALLAAGATTHANSAWEAEYRSIGLAAVAAYDRPALYTYGPHHDAQERAAITVALTGTVLLAGYRADGNAAWLDHARIAADSLLAHDDMNHDGKIGWGRYWPASASGSDGKGGATSFGRGCSLPPNRAYDDELYDDARIADFLLDLYGSAHDRRYLDGAWQVIDATWNEGGTVYGDGFAYWKTTGACSRGIYVKNINMLMAVPMARLAQITGDRRYTGRLASMLRAEWHDLSGKPDFGYYGRQTADRAGYVGASQIRGSDGSAVCNLRTGSGKSCLEHLPIEARSLAIVGRITMMPDSGDVLTIMKAFAADDSQVCGGSAFTKNPTPCVAYYCALRSLDANFDRLCHERTPSARKSQDLILGLLRGAPVR